MNRLTEAWAYMWNNWYQRSRWCLWARSAHPESIPRKRTTMMVEVSWRNLKCIHLKHHNRPRVDFVQNVIITQHVLSYRLKLAQFLRHLHHGNQQGRHPRISDEQAAIKKAWSHLLTRRIQGTYNTDVEHWTCNCGAQKYHSYLLCKHLVQAAGKQTPEWWVQVVRYHVQPFYTVAINGVVADPPELIYDHGWLSRLPGYMRASTPEPNSEPPSSPFHEITNTVSHGTNGTSILD